MRTAVLFGRACCLRQGLRFALRATPKGAQRPFSASSFRSSVPRISQFLPIRRRGLVFLAGATLSPLAFVDLSEKHDDANGKTTEELMLDASREELKEQVPRRLQKSKKFRRKIYFFIDRFIWEPICTGFRFLHLVIIFVPVLASAPIIWMGPRQPEHDNERTGALLWYKYLVWSMECAGASFIKVRYNNAIGKSAWN